MTSIPLSVNEFLSGSRLVVAGVSRSGRSPANAIFRRFRDSGHEVIPVNPLADEVEGSKCYHDLAGVPGRIDGVLIATSPSASVQVVREAVARGITRVWFHRAFDQGSVSDEALRECERAGIKPIVGGCPLMYCAPVDFGHKCFRWILRLQGKVPG